MTLQKLVLIVEDNELNREMLSEILSCEYRVLEAANGQEALDVLKNYKDEISVILLDIIMPVMDGYTFLSIVKSNPSYSAIPVIITTQSDSEADEVTALAHGASDFVAKPYKPRIILHRVASIIHLRETAAMINQFQYDRLTGLYSKEFFYQKVRELLVQYPEREYDIVCSDIENFKLINDIFGIPAGDRLLCEVAELYKKLVGDKGICGRFNADQFVCLMERHYEYTDELFIEGASNVNALSNTKSVVMKWGVYAITDRSLQVEQMCDRALLAAKSIKGQYGKYFAVYDDDLRAKLVREQAVTDSMESALAEEQFVIYMQPKYSAKDERLVGAESLVRWIHPQWGFMSPAEFIPLFEKNGFITKLDQFVWDKTCKTLREWRDKGYPSIPVSVNVSRADVYQADIVDILIKIVKKYDLSPSLLHLEITESAYTENPDQLLNTVIHLRDLGFIIEMDDFGSGYSSLNMLNRMPLDILKLDMKFIQNETAKLNKQGILRFIMGLARWMDLEVVAEGVETQEQLECIRDIGCDYVQGYYFAKPLPCDQFAELLTEPSMTANEERIQGQDGEGNRQILLVADEDRSYREQVRKAFSAKYEVAEAEDAQSAAGLIRNYEPRLAVVLVSMTLPDPQELSVLKILQREKAIWNIPVIATGLADKELEDQALELGADDYAFKPHTPKSLMKHVNRTIGASASWARERVLLDEANRDYLTGLLNRRGLNAAVKALHKEEFPLAVYLFDLDNLKEVNDNLGHTQGDELIKKFGALLHSCTRETDIVSRYGGDEFVAVIKRIDSEQTAIKKGEEICRAFRESDQGMGFAISCTAGTAICGHGQWGISDMLDLADQALYTAKSENKGGCCLWRKG